MPDIDLVIDGVATQLSALMHTGRGVLLDLTSKDHLTDALAGHDSLIDVCRVTTIIDIDVTAVLLRPDGHICWLTSAAQRREPSSSHRAVVRPGRHEAPGGLVPLSAQSAKPGCQRWVIPRSGTVASSWHSTPNVPVLTRWISR